MKKNTAEENTPKSASLTEDSKISGFKGWLPVIGLTFSTFIFNTSEFIPIGLLSDIAGDLHISESHAGLMITVYAWVVALASLPLMLAFAKTESRKLVLGIVTLFAASHILSGIAPDFHMLMLSRMGVACAHAIFWSIVTPLAVRVAPAGKGSTALSIVVAGSSIALIVGLPLGRAIGIAVGWRVTFLIIAAIAFGVLGLLAAVLKKSPSDNNFSLRKLPALIKTPSLWGIYLLTLLAISGHFTAYSYIEPFLSRIAGLGNNAITVVLTLFGAVGLVGSFIFSRHYNNNVETFFKMAVAGLCFCLLMLLPASCTEWSAFLQCMLWGLSINFFNLSFQSEIIRRSPCRRLGMRRHRHKIYRVCRRCHRPRRRHLLHQTRSTRTAPRNSRSGNLTPEAHAIPHGGATRKRTQNSRGRDRFEKTSIFGLSLPRLFVSLYTGSRPEPDVCMPNRP